MLFYEKLYKLRKENGLSQEALAEKLNTSRQADKPTSRQADKLSASGRIIRDIQKRKKFFS